jgi:hypothetical protein
VPHSRSSRVSSRWHLPSWPACGPAIAADRTSVPARLVRAAVSARLRRTAAADREPAAAATSRWGCTEPRGRRRHRPRSGVSARSVRCAVAASRRTWQRRHRIAPASPALPVPGGQRWHGWFGYRQAWGQVVSRFGLDTLPGARSDAGCESRAGPSASGRLAEGFVQSEEAAAPKKKPWPIEHPPPTGHRLDPPSATPRGATNPMPWCGASSGSRRCGRRRSGPMGAHAGRGFTDVGAALIEKVHHILTDCVAGMLLARVIVDDVLTPRRRRAIRTHQPVERCDEASSRGARSWKRRLGPARTTAVLPPPGRDLEQPRAAVTRRGVVTAAGGSGSGGRRCGRSQTSMAHMPLSPLPCWSFELSWLPTHVPCRGPSQLARRARRSPPRCGRRTRTPRGACRSRR